MATSLFNTSSKVILQYYDGGSMKFCKYNRVEYNQTASCVISVHEEKGGRLV